ncbi:hypothetical protein CCP3SC5AM1_10045 [Gammaproteobacteria bacterium]
MRHLGCLWFDRRENIGNCLLQRQQIGGRRFLSMAKAGVSAPNLNEDIKKFCYFFIVPRCRSLRGKFSQRNFLSR